MTSLIPKSHEYLLNDVYHGVLTTLMADGQPQSNLVWLDYDGEYILINTTMERQKSRNVARNPKVSLLVLDPADGSTFISIRGDVVAMVREGANHHLDLLTELYSPGKKYYGDLFPLEKRYEETRVILKILPKRVMKDAIHK
ncbi:MAG: PPOX class F420-dependent oxidoreductase [Candidatus Kariarchaeaceae archaeon]|jgi:PPOX class probable F420-dependent enzyme